VLNGVPNPIVGRNTIHAFGRDLADHAAESLVPSASDMQQVPALFWFNALALTSSLRFFWPN
jgi:cobalamin biosynthesis protein CobD/CbiB